MILDSVDKFRRAFVRRVGVDIDDPELERQGEATNEVIDLCLTEGTREAQRYMLSAGYQGWRKRSSALSWGGSEDTDGGRYVTVPADFLRAYGNDRISALVEPDGTRWGREIRADEDVFKGDFYYLRGSRIWITREAQPPATLYLDFHYQHPAWPVSDEAIDFPVDARSLIIAYAGKYALFENWLTGGKELQATILRAIPEAERKARDVARLSKRQRRMHAPRRLGNHW